MKTIILAAALGILATSASAGGLRYQNGYFKQDGSYTQGHWKTNPDSNPYNNRAYILGY